MNRTTYRAMPKARPVAPLADALRYTITAKGLHALAAHGSPIEAAAPVTRDTWRPRPVEGAAPMTPAAAPPCKACDVQPADITNRNGLCAACAPYFDSYDESLDDYRARVQARQTEELEAFADAPTSGSSIPDSGIVLRARFGKTTAAYAELCERADAPEGENAP